MNTVVALLGPDQIPTPGERWLAGIPLDWVAAALITALVLPALFGLFYLGYYLFSLPLRRREGARLFLDLVETGIESGHGVEQAVLSAARHGVHRLSRKFREFAERLTEGLGFAQALELTPGLVPAPVSAMLRAGAELGDLRKTLPGCRRLIRDATAPLLKAQHYLMLLVFVTSPMWIAAFLFLTVCVVPKLEQIQADVAEGAPAGLMQGLIEWRHGLLAVQVTIVVCLWSAAIVSWGGPRLQQWFTRRVPLPWSHLALQVPWQRNRLLRDFATLLGVALDSGLPEPRAVMLAADGAANEVLRARAVSVLKDLQEGFKLPQALRRVDTSRELEWRLENAAHGRTGFAASLAGWEESLDARAFHQEQVAAQLLTTGLVLLNGVMVALLTAGVFQMLIRLISSAALW